MHPSAIVRVLSSPLRRSDDGSNRLADVGAPLTVVESRRYEEAALVARTGVRRRVDTASKRGDNICRSHGVLTVCIAILDPVTQFETTGKLHVVELAAGVRAGRC